MPKSVHHQDAAWLGGRSHCSEYQKRYAPQNYARPRHCQDGPVRVAIRGDRPWRWNSSLGSFSASRSGAAPVQSAASVMSAPHTRFPPRAGGTLRRRNLFDEEAIKCVPPGAEEFSSLNANSARFGAGSDYITVQPRLSKNDSNLEQIGPVIRTGRSFQSGHRTSTTRVRRMHVFPPIRTRALFGGLTPTCQEYLRL
jgi:hypothetical protein